MRKDKLVEISGGKCVAADVSTAAAAIIKANYARGLQNWVQRSEEVGHFGVVKVEATVSPK